MVQKARSLILLCTALISRSYQELLKPKTCAPTEIDRLAKVIYGDGPSVGRHEYRKIILFPRIFSTNVVSGNGFTNVTQTTKDIPLVFSMREEISLFLEYRNICLQCFETQEE